MDKRNGEWIEGLENGYMGRRMATWVGEWTGWWEDRRVRGPIDLLESGRDGGRIDGLENG